MDELRKSLLDVMARATKEIKNIEEDVHVVIIQWRSEENRYAVDIHTT